MEYSIIVESNQEIAKNNYAVDYGTAITTDTYDDEFSNNKWKIKLPQSITLDVGDKIQYYSSMIKTRGLSDEGVELIGTAGGNQELTDNAGRMQFGYYIYNNWLNNCMLPLGQATLKSPQAQVLGTSDYEYRQFNYQDTKHTFNIADETETNIPRVWWSDYGGPSLETIDDWIINGSSSLYQNANEVNNVGLFGKKNANTTATNNLAHYVPDTQRLYVGAQDWVGPYINGYTSYHNQALSGTYSSKYDIVKSNADFQTDLGFNSPIVIGNKITESLNNPNLEGNDEFVNPILFDYTDDLTTDTSLTTYKNYFDSFTQLQVEDESCKCFPTTYGKMLYDLQNGVDNFSINTTLQTKTNIALPTSAQKIKYFWNCVASGDYKRTIASSELYSNLNLSKNIQTLNVNSLSNSSFFSGTIPPDTNYPPTPPSTTKIIADNAAYPTSAPYDLGEQFCLFDNFDGAFSSNFDATEIAKITNNIIFRSDTLADYNTIKKPTTADEYLNLSNNQVFMTNMIANDANFDKLKIVRDLLEKPSADDIKIDYTDQTFLDSLYFSLEVGALDDRFSQSVYGLTGNTTIEETGIPLPVALPSVKSIADKLEPTDASALSYISYKDRMRIPIYSGLFCDEDNIVEKNDGANKYTLLKEWRDNKMYEMDFYSRYNASRIPSSNTLTLPTSTDFDFKDANGNYFDDSKIKENDLGVVVAYKNIIEDGDTALEFGLGSQPGANQFSLYSVDTTNNYSVNSGVFVNKSSDSDLTKFGDNSVQSLTTNNTIYLSQNTSNAYSEATDLETISPTKALVVEYESNKPFIPSEVELYQQASYPDPSLAGFETTLGAGINLAHFTAGGGSVVVNTKLGASADSRGFDNITGDFANCLVFGSTFTITIDYGVGITKNIKHFRMWARNFHTPNETPTEVEIFGSNDNFATQTSLFNGSWSLSDVPTFTGNITPSHNLNLSLKKDLTITGDYRYYRFQFPTAPNTYYSIGELALYEKVLTSDVSVLGAGVSLTDFLANNTNSAITPFNLFAGSTLDRGFENLTGTFDKCLCLKNGNGPAVLFINFGDVGVKISKFRIWARSDFRNEMVRKMSVEGSMDNITYTTLFDNQSSPFNTGNSGNNYEGDYPLTTDGMVPSENLDKALTRTLNNQAAYKYYNFKFYENSIPITNGAYLIGELGLYISGANNNITSRFPKNIQIQGQQINSTTWTTLDTHSLDTAPDAAGGNTLPQNPVLTSFLPPIKEPFNQNNLSYKKLRLVITETFGLSGNNVNIGEWVLRKRNNFSTYLGDASTPFDVNDVELKAYFPTANIDFQFTEDPNVFVNFNPAGSPSPKDAIRDGDLSSDMDITMNTTATYSTSANQVIIGSNQGAGQRFLGLEYKLTQSNPLGEVFNDFLIYTSSILAKLPFLPKGVIIMGITEDGGQEGLFNGDLTSSQPTQATDVSIGANSPYGAVIGKNTSNDRFKSFLMLVKSTFNLSTNRIVIPDIIVSGYDSANHIVHNTPFIGFNCRNQISSLNKYRIPRPINGEHFGIPRSLQNNSLSFINSWERKVKNDDKGVRVVKVELENSPILITTNIPPLPAPTITAEFYGGNPTTAATIDVEVSIDGPIVNINNLIITNNGEHYESLPDIVFKENGNDIKVNSNAWLQRPEINITLGTFKTSYNAGVEGNNQSQFPYIMMGANDVSVSFDTTQSRMSLSKMHTLMKEGQEDNNMQRYYDASMFFNADKALIVPDGESGNNVLKIHNKKTYCNSTRAGFTEAKPKDDFNRQIIPISNPAIRQKGIASGISGIGLLELFAKKKDGSYNKISINNEHSYNGTLLDRLGFDIKQLLPRFGTQNEVFNRGLYNKNINDNDKALSQYNQQVLPLTTNGFISATLNQSLNTNSVNYLVGSADGNNLLEKSVPQESDALIASNLAQKFSYSHLLVYSNIIPKYNYIAAEKINKTNCIASINRSYEVGDVLYGNAPGIPYIVDKKYVLTDIDVDLRTELGIPAPIDGGSTIVFKIDKRKNIPILPPSPKK